jgi:hypothetical protein
MRNLLVVTLAMILCGCATKPAEQPASKGADEDRWRATDDAVVDVLKRSAAAGATTKPRFGVTHIVLCWLKTPGDAAQRRQLIEAAHKFHTIPGVSLIAAGQPIASTRPVIDSSYDVGFVMMFEDEAGMQAYLDHPQHREAVAKLLRPLTSRTVVYDFRNERQ